MKPRRNAIIFITVAFLVLKTTESAGGYIGCYQANRINGRFTRNPGTFRPDNLTPYICQNACGSQGYVFAGLTQGSFCFCDTVLPPLLEKTTDSFCSKPCSGDVTVPCGDLRYVSVYKVESAVVGLSITPTPKVVDVFGSIGFAVSYSQGIPQLVYRVNYDDDTASITYNETDPLSNSFSIPGEHTVTVAAGDTAGNAEERKASTRVLVQSKATNLTLSCPTVVSTYEEMVCNGTVFSGIYMRASVDYGDGTRNEFSVADAQWHTAGHGVPQHGTYSSAAQPNTVNIINSDFQYPGTLVAFEFYAIQTGSIDLLVLTPDCPTLGTSYCHQTHDCAVSCESRWHQTCDGAKIFCTTPGVCVDTGSPVCNTSVSDRYTVTPTQFAVKAKLPYTISQTGHNIYQLDLAVNSIEISPGDIIGYISKTAGDGVIATATPSAEEIYDKIYSPNPTVNQGEILIDSYSDQTYLHLIRAIASRPTQFSFYRTFTEPGNYTLQLNVSTAYIVSLESQSHVIEVAEGINTTVITGPPFAASNETVTFSLLPHTGSDLSYDWQFSDGATQTTTVPEVTHTYVTQGQHNVSVMVSNAVTSSSNSTGIEIQERIVMTSCGAAFSSAAVNVPGLYSISLSQGSSVSVTWDYVDGSPVDTYTTGNFQPWPGGAVTQTHTFTALGVYNVAITAQNAINLESCIASITVSTVVLDLVFNSDSPTEYLSRTRNGTISFWFTGSPLPPDTLVTFDFGDGIVAEYLAFGLDLVYSHDYHRRGTFNVLATVHVVGVGDVSYATKVSAIEPVANMFIHLDPPHPSIGAPFTIAVSMDKGQNVTLYFDWEGDGIVDLITPRIGSTPYDLDTVSHIYTAETLYNLQVMASNVLGNTTIIKPLVAQYPVTQDYTLVTTAPLTFPAQVDLTLSVPALGQDPSTAYIVWDYGDGTVETAAALQTSPFTVTKSHTYSTPGNHQTTVTIYNLASSQEYIISSGVFVPITMGSVRAVYRPPVPVNSPLLPGTGPDQIQFPFHLPVIFEVLSLTGTIGSIYVEATPVSGGTTLTASSSINPVPLQLNTIGGYNISVNVSNPVSWDATMLYVEILYAVEGLAITDNRIATGAYEVKNFDLSFATVSADSCLDVIWGDDSPLITFGPASCTVATSAGPVSNPMTISHVYTAEGTYTVNATGYNSIGSSHGQLTFAVSKVNCRAPIVDIEDRTPLFFQPRQVPRKDEFSIRGITRLECSTTVVNQKTWHIYEIDPMNGDVLQPVDIQTLPTRFNSELVIPSSFLKYRSYKFIYSVRMGEEDQPTQVFFAEQDTFIEVIKSKLIPMIYPGGMNLITRGLGDEVTLSPDLYSRDPDVDPDINQGITVVGYFCRHVDETLPRNPDGSLSTAGCSVPYTAAQLAAATIPNNGGCFRQGAGCVSNNQPSLTFNTGNMQENQTYEFLVVVKKDNREATATLRLDIVSGVASPIVIECLSELCKAVDGNIVVNAMERLPLRVRCDANCQDIKYEWKLYRQGLTDTWIEIEDLSAFVEGIESSEIAIPSQVFKDGFEMYTDLYKYRIRVAAISPTGVVSVGVTELTMNRGPLDGTCSLINVIEGSRNDKFRLDCSGWTDPDGIAMYQVYAVFKDEEVKKQVYFGKQSTAECYLPWGLKPNNYFMDVFVRVLDKNGAFTDFRVGRQKVKPTPDADTIAEMAKLTRDVDNEVFIAAAEEIIEEANAKFIKAANILNKFKEISRERYTCNDYGSKAAKTYGPVTPHKKLNTRNCTEYEAFDEDAQYQIERNDRAKIRTAIVKSCSKMTKKSWEALQLCTSTVSLITDPVEEVTRATQITLVDSLLDMTEAVKAKSRSREIDVDVIRGLLHVTGNVLMATESTLYDGILSDLDEAAETDFYDYDTDLESTRDGFRHLKQYKMGKAFRLETNFHVQKKEGHVITDKALTAINRLGEIARESLVSGENSIDIVTPRVSFSVEKNEASTIDYHTKEIGRSKVKVIPFSKMRPDLPTDMDVTSEFFSLPFSPYRCSKAASMQTCAQSNAPDTLSYSLYSDSGGNEISVNESEVIEYYLDFNVITGADVIYEMNSTGIPYHCHRFNRTGSDSYIGLKFTFYDAEANCTNLDDNCSTSDIRLHIYQRSGLFPNLENATYDYFTMTPFSEEYPQNFFMGKTELGTYVGREIICFMVANGSDPTVYDNTTRPPATFPDQLDITYSLAIVEGSCLFWNGTDWDSTGLTGEPSFDWTQLVCFTTHLTMFTGDMVVQPNELDFAFIFSNMDFDKNPTLYITEIVIACIYIIAAIWAMRQDKKDIFKLGVTPLPDNDPRDRYLYHVTIETGLRKDAATDSKVHFIVSGEYEETNVRVLQDDKRKILRRGATDNFLLAVPRPLGPLNYLRVWHDNAGKGQYASWYLRHIIFHDLQTKEKFFFLSNRWFAVEKDDGQVDRLLPVASVDDMVAFSYKFGKETQKNLGDEHLWFSVVGRPPQSRFTRLQRVTCCLCLLFTSMLANAMFYGTTEDAAGQGMLTVGPFAISPEQIYVGIICNLIVFPVNFLVIWLFRRSRPRRKRPSRIQAALAMSRPNSGSSQNDTEAIIDSQDWNNSQTEPVIPMTPVTARGIQLQNMPKKKKKKFSLPWGFRVVAWVIMWLTILACAAFVTFYGVMFQDLKCKKWITSMIISFVTSIFLTQPIKVFLAALIFSMIFKKSTDEDEAEEDEEEPQLQADEEWLHRRPSSLEFGIASGNKAGYRPPDATSLERAREYRLKEVKMYDVLREILLYSFFLWILMVVSYGFRDPNAFIMKGAMDAIFTTSGLPKRLSTPYNDFTKVRTREHFWAWSKTVLIPGLRAGTWYNGDQPLGQRGLVEDRTSRLMGYAILRQLRVKKAKCDVKTKLSLIIPECNVAYTIADQDENDYATGWTTSDETDSNKSEYTYRSGSDLNSYPFWGEQAVYSGGGYVVPLRGSAKVLQNKLVELEKEQWIDSYTRAVFVEFTVYNAQVNLFGICTYLAEFLHTGGISVYYRIEPMNLLSNYSSAMLFQIGCELAFLVFIIFFIVKEIRNVIRQKKLYLKEIWNWVELLIIALSIAATGIYFYRMILTKELVNLFKETHGNQYMKFQYVGYWNELLQYLVSWLVFMATIKFIRLLRFNKRMSLLASTLRYGAKPMALFGIIFACVFFAYVQYFYLIFFTELLNFSTIIRAAETCLQMLVGKFNFSAMQFSSPFLGSSFFFLYVVTVYYILVNMFLTILNESFAAVRRDLDKQSNEHELVDFMCQRLMQWTGLGRLMGRRTDKPEKESLNPNDPAFNRMMLECFPDRVDQLLAYISKMSVEKEDCFDALFIDKPATKKGKAALPERPVKPKTRKSYRRSGNLPDVDVK